MNGYKLRAIIEHVRNQGRLPTDQWGEVLSPDDLLVWFGLHDLLSPYERAVVKAELEAIAQAEAIMDQLRSRV